MSELIVGFEFDLWELTESDQLTFGRSADLAIGHDAELDATLGMLHRENNRWRLRNLGSEITMTVHDKLEGTSTRVQPGCSSVVPLDSFGIAFDGADESYELKGTCWPRTDFVDRRSGDRFREPDSIAS